MWDRNWVGAAGVLVALVLLELPTLLIAPQAAGAIGGATGSIIFESPLGGIPGNIAATQAYRAGKRAAPSAALYAVQVMNYWRDLIRAPLATAMTAASGQYRPTPEAPPCISAGH